MPFCCGSFNKAGVSDLSQIYSLSNFIANKLYKASATREAIWLAFPSLRSLSFGPDEINNPYNALTLASALHVEFGGFSIALERTVSSSSKCSASI